MTRRDLAKRLDDLEETIGTDDEVEAGEQELTESQQSAIDAIIDHLSDEERALASAIVEYADDVDDPMFHGEYGGEGATQAGADYLEIVCNPGPSARNIDRERYEEYL